MTQQADTVREVLDRLGESDEFVAAHGDRNMREAAARANEFGVELAKLMDKHLSAASSQDLDQRVAGKFYEAFGTLVAVVAALHDSYSRQAKH